jgi:hypothetical protein
MNAERMEALLVAWGRAVDDVERGYPLTFDDYLNDLDGRRALASAPLDAGQRHRLDAFDARFVTHTRRVEQCVWGEENALAEGWDRSRQWWYYRLPNGVAFDER